MNQPRILLWVGLLLLVYLNVNAWLKDYAPAVRETPATESKPPESWSEPRGQPVGRTAVGHGRGSAGGRARDAVACNHRRPGGTGPARSASLLTCSTSTSASRVAN